MFLKASRYFELDTAEAVDDSGRVVRAVKLRRLPETSGQDMIVTDSDQLDMISQARYGDATLFWHIADANSTLEANELVKVAGRVIRVPGK